jgi:hypothetical protein
MNISNAQNPEQLESFCLDFHQELHDKYTAPRAPSSRISTKLPLPLFQILLLVTSHELLKAVVVRG